MCNTPLIDVRPEAQFLLAHEPGAANLPLEELPTRVHELPAKGHGVRIVDSDPARAAAAQSFFTARGTPVRVETFDPLRQVQVGPSRVRLWEPSPFLAEALDSVAREKPLQGLTALDVACGTGRDAVYMALRGMKVTAIDHLPDALVRANDLARRSDTKIATLSHDLERTNSLPPETFADGVTVFRYFHRPLFPALVQAVSAGGYVIYETFHERNLETGQKPRNADHLLRTAELPTYFPGFQILIFRDAWERDGRWFSSLLARKPNVR